MPEELEQTDEWGKWSRHVLFQIEHQDALREELRKEVIKLQKDVAVLQIKAGIWGGLAGMVPVLLYIAYQILKIGGGN